MKTPRRPSVDRSTPVRTPRLSLLAVLAAVLTLAALAAAVDTTAATAPGVGAPGTGASSVSRGSTSNHPDADSADANADVKQIPEITYDGDTLSRLRSTIENNPLDIDALARLEAFHRRQRDNRLSTLYEFAAALEAYRTGFPYLLAHWDPNAPDAAYAGQFAQAFLSVPIEDLIDDARRLAEAPLCPDCGNTRRTDCRSCRGTGQVRCPTCRGRGFDPAGALRQSLPMLPLSGPGQPPWSVVNQPCPTCSGRGLVVCDRCAGRGTLPCRRCQAPPPPEFTARLIGQIQNLNIAVNFLRVGGPDIYTTVGTAPAQVLP